MKDSTSDSKRSLMCRRRAVWVQVGCVLFAFHVALLPGAYAQPVSPASAASPDSAVATEPEVNEPWFAPMAELWSRYELRRGYDALGLTGPARLNADQDAIYYRTRFGGTTRQFPVADGLAASVRVIPQASGVWGIGGDDLNDVALNLHEGYFSLHGTGFRLDVGRRELSYGEHLVIGAVPWHQTGRSFDGLFGRIDLGVEGAYVDVWTSWISEGFLGGNATPFGAQDGVFSGIYAGLGPLLGDLEADLYLLNITNPGFTDGGSGDTFETSSLFTLGARVKGANGDFVYRGEAGVQAGATAAGGNALAYQVDVEFGVLLFEKRLRLTVEGLFASGDADPADANQRGWNQLFPTPHKWLGLTDIIGARSNIASGVWHGSLKATDQLTLQLHAHVFFRPEGPVTGYVGAEVDTAARWAIGQGLSLWLNYNLFVPSQDAFASNGVAHFLEVQFRYRTPSG